MHKSHIRKLITFCATAIVAASADCSLSTAPGTVSSYGSGSRRILFIGNSLTSANDMPAMLVALAESAKVSPLPRVDVDWLPDFALIDHWNLGQAQGFINAGHYDVVIMQQGPSSVEVNRDTLRLAASLFAPLVRATGGTPALLAVWPTIDRLVDFDRATESYRLAAVDVHGFMFPGGEVWRAAWRRNPNLQFYSDGLHPNALGSYAVALSVFGLLYDRSAVGLPTSIRIAGQSDLVFDGPTARLVQQAADEANAQYGVRPSP